MNNSDTEAVALLSTIERQIRKNEFSVRGCSLSKTRESGPAMMRLVLDFAIEPARVESRMPGLNEYMLPGALDAALKTPKPQPLQPFGSRDLDID